MYLKILCFFFPYCNYPLFLVLYIISRVQSINVFAFWFVLHKTAVVFLLGPQKKQVVMWLRWRGAREERKNMIQIKIQSVNYHVNSKVWWSNFFLTEG